MKDSDFTVKGKRIEIQLPPPEIVSFEMDPNHIRTEVTDVNGFRASFSQEEKMEVLKKGEEVIRKELQKLHILDEAEKNASQFIRDFYINQGFEEVIIHESSKAQRNKNLDR